MWPNLQESSLFMQCELFGLKYTLDRINYYSNFVKSFCQKLMQVYLFGEVLKVYLFRGTFFLS